jgi:proteic killer suppression protein
VIKTWKNAKSRRIYEEGKTRGFSGLDLDDALEVLKMLNAAPALDRISPLKSIGLHRLKGDRKGQWAMTINGPWRVCFQFRGGNAYDVEITDYHRG